MKNEISISCIKISTYPDFMDMSHDYPFNLVKGLTLIYKRNLKPNIYLRASGSSHRYSTHYPEKNSTCNDCSESDYTSSENYFNIGFEYRPKKSGTRRVSVYSGIDLTGFYFKSKGEYWAWLSGNYKFKNTTSGYGLQPFIGLRTCLFKRIVISAESSMLMGRQTSVLQQTKLYEPFDTRTSKQNDFSLQINFMRLLSIGFAF